MEVVGEEGIAMKDMIVYLKAELYDFSYLQQNAFDKEDAYCSIKRQMALLSVIREIFNIDFHFDTHDDARSFFLTLQNKIKNMNFMPFESPQYRELHSEIKEMLAQQAERIVT